MLEVATRSHPTTPKNHRTHQGMRIRQTGKSSLVLSGSPDSWLQPSSVAPWKPHLPLRLILKGGAHPLLKEDVNLSGDGIVSLDPNVFQLVKCTHEIIVGTQYSLSKPLLSLWAEVKIVGFEVAEADTEGTASWYTALLHSLVPP